jgi:hypothetical protein
LFFTNHNCGRIYDTIRERARRVDHYKTDNTCKRGFLNF